MNLPALATLPISVVLVLSAFLPFLDLGDFAEFGDDSLSGWQFFSSVDFYMLVAVALSIVLVLLVLLPQMAEATVSISIAGDDTDARSFPLYAVFAALVAFFGFLIFALVALKIIDVPFREGEFGPTRGFGMFAIAALAFLLGVAGAAAVAWPYLMRNRTAPAAYSSPATGSFPAPQQPTGNFPAPEAGPPAPAAPAPSQSPPESPAPGAPRSAPPPDPSQRKG
jgi:hypothetical protein